MPAGRILIVDDDPDTLEDGKDRLGREGHHVETAMDRESALSRLSDPDGWDVVLLDVKLRGPEGPDVGLDLLEDIQARRPSPGSSS